MTFDPRTQTRITFHYSTFRPIDAGELAKVVGAVNRLGNLHVEGISETAQGFSVSVTATFSSGIYRRDDIVRDRKRILDAASVALPSLLISDLGSSTAGLVSDAELGTRPSDIIREAAADTTADLKTAAKVGLPVLGAVAIVVGALYLASLFR